MRWQTEYLSNVKFCQDIVQPRLGVPSLRNIAKDMKVIASVGRPKVVKLWASGGLRPLRPWPPDQGLPLDPAGAPPTDPRYRLALRTRHGSPSPGPSVALTPLVEPLQMRDTIVPSRNFCVMFTSPQFPVSVNFGNVSPISQFGMSDPDWDLTQANCALPDSLV